MQKELIGCDELGLIKKAPTLNSIGALIILRLVSKPLF
jgi:hypothetical protein